MNKMKLGLCAGRHEIPEVSGFIFENIVDPTDLTAMLDTVHYKLQFCTELTLYVTGLSVALVSVINYCCKNHIPLALMHYNAVKGEYYEQEVLTMVDYDLLVEGGYKHAK